MLLEREAERQKKNADIADDSADGDDGGGDDQVQLSDDVQG